MTKPNYSAFITALKAAKTPVALTGAGVSTFSGIRDFRGKNGIYNQPDPALAEKLFDIDYFDRDPKFYYTRGADFIYGLAEKTPSIVHLTLAELERRGMLAALITQNIDLLHQKAGSQRVIEIHGSPQIHYCRRCGSPEKSVMSYDEVAVIAKSGAVPLCKICGAALKPAITFFGENLPARAMAEAQSFAARADLLLVLGTSLTVYPAASLPQITLQHGGAVAIVNDQPTPLDGYVRFKFDDLGEFCAALKDF